MEGGDDGRPPPTVLERLRVLEQDMSARAAAVKVVPRASSAPPAPRPSLPVRAAVGGYRLTKAGMILLGVLVAIGECVARRAGVDTTPMSQTFDLIVEPAPPSAQ